MDEPLANLDALIRLQMRVRLKKLQNELKETFVYVTHDQVEALSMGDRVAILNHGKIQQIGTPESIYHFPNHIFSASVLGIPPINLLDCGIKREDDTLNLIHKGMKVQVCNGAKITLEKQSFSPADNAAIIGVRPEDVKIHLQAPTDGESIPAEIFVVEPLGNETIVDVNIRGKIIKALVDARFDGCSKQKVWVSFDCSKLHIFCGESKCCLYHAESNTDFKLEG
jgi:ABC-type sugar transport system ATPase subunit